jgi:anaerobic dimethyl sulfoxide reductase subunit B
MNKKRQLGFYLDAGACIGCKACQTACKDKNDLPVGLNWRKVIEFTGGGWNHTDGVDVPVNLFTYHITVSCQHCENPPCLPVCPTSAITKDEDGVVLINPDKCVGCQYCSWACPYGAPQFGPRGEPMSKCDLCADLRAIGQNPACVDACPLRALDWGDMEELREKYGTIDTVEPLPDGKITKPSMVITPHRDNNLSAKGHIANLPPVSTKGKNVIGPNPLKYQQ